MSFFHHHWIKAFNLPYVPHLTSTEESFLACIANGVPCISLTHFVKVLHSRHVLVGWSVSATHSERGGRRGFTSQHALCAYKKIITVKAFLCKKNHDVTFIVSTYPKVMLGLTDLGCKGRNSTELSFNISGLGLWV